MSLDIQNRSRVLPPGSGDFRKRSLASNDLHVMGRSSCFGLHLGSVDMEFGIARGRAGVFRSPTKARSVVRAQASGLSFL